MADIVVREWLLKRAGGACRSEVVPQVESVENTMSDAASDPAAANMGPMVSAAAARTCLDGWQETFQQATRTMRDVAGNLVNTAAAVTAADQDAADLYTGPPPRSPTSP